MNLTRAVLSLDRALHGVRLPDPARVDCGEVPDPVVLLRAIHCAMPDDALVELVRPHNERLRDWLSACPSITVTAVDRYALPVGDVAFSGLLAVVRRCPPRAVCSHIFVHHGAETLVEAYGRDRGETVVWLHRDTPKPLLQRFREAVALSHSGSVPMSLPNRRTSLKGLQSILAVWVLMLG